MKRRSFLGFLTGAAAAGPQAIAEQAKRAGINATGLGVMTGPSVGSIYPPDGPGIAEERASIMKQMAAIAGRPRRPPRFDSVHNLDPDVAAWRSFSLSARVRVQRDRNWRREADQETHWLTHRLTELMKGK